MLVEPNFDKPFKLMVDTSDVGCAITGGEGDVVYVFSHTNLIASRNTTQHVKRRLWLCHLICNITEYRVYLPTPVDDIVGYADHNPWYL